MKQSQNYKKRRIVHSLHKMGIFMCQNLVNNRIFAIFAPHLAYEVQ